MKKVLFTLSLLLCLVVPALAQPVVSAVLNGASYSSAASPGCWVAVFGSNLAPAVASAQSVPLAKQLGGVTVTIGDVAAPLLFVSPQQVNALVPFEVTIASNSVVPMVVTTPQGASAPYGIRLERSAPALFTLNSAGTGRAHVYDPFFQPVETIGTQDALILYAVGLGPTDPPAQSDLGGSSAEPSNRVVDDLQVYIGEEKADILFAGLAPGFPGVYQLNVKPTVPSSDRLYLRMNGWQSNVTEIGIAPGNNVANVTGSIEGIYPPTNPEPGAPAMSALGISVAPQAVKFSVGFDILPGARPFSVAAVSEAGSSVIQIDPVKGTVVATTTMPTQAARLLNFSDTEFHQVMDWYTCHGEGSSNGAVCVPFAGNMIPMSRMDPVWYRASSLLPTPTATTPGSAIGTFQATGTVTAGSHFAVDNALFGGFVQLQYGPFTEHVSSAKLYVDGRLITSRDLVYPLLHY